VRLAPGRGPAVAAERLVVSRGRLAAELGPAVEGDEDLLRHAADRIAARLPGHVHAPGSSPDAAGGVPGRAPVLLPLPLGPSPGPAPRPGLIGVLPLAAAAPACGPALAERRAELAALGWRLGVGGLDAAALRFVALQALEADVLLLRWSPALAQRGDALRGADPHKLVLTGCDGPEAVGWGRDVGLVLFSGPAAEATLAPRPSPAEAAPC
jgi:hypothetical protein